MCLSSGRVVSREVGSGMSGRIENVLTGGSRAFKVKEKRTATCAKPCGSHRRVSFFGAGAKSASTVSMHPGRLPDPDMRQCGTFQDTVRAPSTHFWPHWVPVIRWLVLVYFLGSAVALGLPSCGFFIHHLLFGFSEGTQMGPVPVKMVKGLIRSFDPAPFSLTSPPQ